MNNNEADDEVFMIIEDNDDTEEIETTDSSESVITFALWPKEPSYFGPTTRSIEVMGPITNELATKVIGHTLTLESLDPKAPIYVYINSPGGDYYAGLGIYDVLRTVTCPIVTMTFGMAGSAAFIISLAGDERYASESSTFFYHNVSSWQVVDSEVSNMEQYKHYKWCNRRMEDIICDRIGMKRKKFLSKFGNSTTHRYITAKEAKKLNIINKIQPYKKSS